MKKWKVTRLDYREVPSIKGTWAIDPPYQGQYSKKYATCDLDYTELAEWCTTREGLVIVSENEGADWLPFTPLAVSISHNRQVERRLSRPIEVIWLKGMPEDPFIL